MRLTRCYLDQPLDVGTTVILPESAAQHLIRVLRLREGDACMLFNGDGHDHDARIVAIGKRETQAEITARRRIDNESPLRITLLQGIARGEKMDWIVQKATELGVARILPVASERSDVRLDEARAHKRHAHWQEIAISACEQSGRAVLPELLPTQPLASATRRCDGTGFILDPASAASIKSVASTLSTASTLAIGPEGGWSPRDLEQLREAGFCGLRLGPRVLRTETAGIAAIAALQALAGDLG
ncbi:16S rRNA (uracil(1498)-N(3))-methyltransferase [Thermomonas sp.]|uniref:16S rRNA (uracil(1498)-N(3))-methyltransferase n=1 Tax=Thermomonas sp. TaxID=1971895 RepID=UPI00261EF797|nr:16S rRNA (uracil(1498)-N(3))-methyltransferase [Thermomonas sp.]